MMPAGVYAQEKACQQEEKLISRLQQLELDTTLVDVLCRQANMMLEGTHNLCTALLFSFCVLGQP